RAGSGDDENLDITPGSDYGDPQDDGRFRRRLRDMALEAEKLKGDSDAKMVRAVSLIQKLLDDGFSPIVFCRFIPTAEYVAAELRSRLKGQVEVASVTGNLPPEARKERVAELAEAPRRVLVAP